MTTRGSSTVTNPVVLTTQEPEPATNSTLITRRAEATAETAPTTLSATTTESSPDVIDKECRVPAYASINYETVFSAPVTNNSLLVVEGRCYIACMEILTESDVGFGVSSWYHSPL